MSRALMPSRVSISARISTVQGSAPKKPTRSLPARRSTPASSAASAKKMAYEGVQHRGGGSEILDQHDLAVRVAA